MVRLNREETKIYDFPGEVAPPATAGIERNRSRWRLRPHANQERAKRIRCSCPGRPHRAKLHTAHEIAMRDPKVRAAREQRNRANKKYHAALRAAMLKADPSLQPILDKIDQHKKNS
jgi:hypothetical protein